MPGQQEDLETALYRYWIIKDETRAQHEKNMKLVMQGTQTSEDKAVLYALTTEEGEALDALRKIPEGYERSRVRPSLSDLEGQPKYAALAEQRKNTAARRVQEAKEARRSARASKVKKANEEAGQQEAEPSNKGAKSGGKHVRFA